VQASSNKVMTRWIKDLQWRVAASENEIWRRFEPDRTRAIIRKRTDETETAIYRPPERVLGLAVRYEVNQDDTNALDDDFL